MFDALLLISIIAHLILCPFTKVEESFNMQAMHDMLTYGFFSSSLLHYDHFLFPGVVPRTFCGALVISIIALIPSSLIPMIQLPSYLSLYVCRGILGAVVWLSMRRFGKSIGSKYSPRCSRIFMILMSLQFHIPFYASRTLPNIFALAFALNSYAEWLQVIFVYILLSFLFPPLFYISR
jgi:alpha-1,6-mannosyltransferase